MVAGLQISGVADAAADSPAHQRFDRLIAQIEQARAALAAWHAQRALYEQAHARSVGPLLRRLHAVRRETVVALDRLSDEAGWNREEQATLRDFIVDATTALLDEHRADHDQDGDDAVLAGLLARHREPPVADRGVAAAPAAVEANDPDDAGFDEEAFMRLHDQRAADRRSREQARRSKRRSAAARQRDADAERARGSMRDVFRRLASALHPDRESDPARRDAKTALMQRVNRAYAADDLLGLLELQLETAQIDAGQLAGASAQRLEHYNRMLGEQEAELKAELGRKEAAFRAELGLAPGAGLSPARLVGYAREDAQALRAAIAAHEEQLRAFADRATVRRWLKQVRRQRHGAADADGRAFAEGPWA